MSSSAGRTSIVLSSALLALVGLLAPQGAAAQQAGGAPTQQAGGGDQRCTGTLCDFYYGPMGNKYVPTPTATTQQTAAPAARTASDGGIVSGFTGFFSGIGNSPSGPRPEASPGDAAPAGPTDARPFVKGGGLMNIARGAPDERCGGTLCDFYYGGPSPAEQRSQQPGAATSQPLAAATGLAPGGPPADDTPRPARARRATETAERQEYRRCVAPPGDPWKCYR